MESNLETRFEKAINSLIKAFHNGTLAKDTCYACAVGNIVAAGLSKKVYSIGGNYKWEGDEMPIWQELFVTSWGKQHGQIHSDEPEDWDQDAVEQVESTGYSPYELALVESAFEANCSIDAVQYKKHDPQTIIDDQFNGLMAVVDVLMKIEERAGNVVRNPKSDFKKEVALAVQ